MSAEVGSRELLRVDAVSKAFPGVQALDDVELTVQAGEVHGLVGANGSGKSTLVKTLAGYHSPDSGDIWLRGARLPGGYSPSFAAESGMHFLHQDSPLFHTLTVAENFALLGSGFSKSRFRRIRWRQTRRRVAAALADMPHAPRPGARAGALTPAERATLSVAILREASEHDVGLLVLDEPTAALSVYEARDVMGIAREMANRGFGVIFISHRLWEVRDLCDRVTIIRDGRVAATLEASQAPAENILEHMFGYTTAVAGAPLPEQGDSHLTRRWKGTAGGVGEPAVGSAHRAALSVAGLSGWRVRDVSFDLQPGEVLGVAGLIGCGRSELGRLLVGLQEITEGTLCVNGRTFEKMNLRDAYALGFAYIPADRLEAGVAAQLSVRHNLLLRHGRARALAWTTERDEAAEWHPVLQAFRVEPADPERVLGTLSGGNQQKVVLAKWLTPEPRVLVMDEPTRGVDVNARQEIYEMLRRMAQRGVAIVVLSSDEEEIAAACTSTLVLRDGKLVSRLDGTDLTKEQIIRAAYG